MAQPSEYLWTSEQQPSFSWVERNGKFVGVNDGHGTVGFEDIDLEQVLPAFRSDKCDEGKCGNWFPHDFRYCPECSAELRAPCFGKDRLWSYPGPEGDGLPNSENVEIKD